MFTSFRARLIATVILLVTLTAVLVGTVAYLLVRDSLRDQLVEDAVARAEFNITVLASEEQLPANAGRDEFGASGLADRFLLGDAGGFYVEFESGATWASSLALLGTGELMSAELRRIVGRGEYGYEFLTVEEESALVVGGRRPPAGPEFYFFSSAGTVADTLSQLRRVLVIAAGGVVLVGIIAAGLIARRVLRPVARAAQAAEDMAGGDLSVRLPVESSDEIGRWAEAFNRMASSLQEQIDALVAAEERERRFVADVSHEFRTPITALVNEAAMLDRHLDTLPESGKHVGELLIGDVDRLRRLVEDLLEISRLDAGSAVEVSLVDMNAFLSAVIANRHSEARLQVTGVDGPLPADRRALERIVGNLLDNARSHAPGTPTVVDVVAEAGVLRIRVSDEGPGVTEGDLDRLFDRFYTGDDSRQGGTGLGLAIARQHARRLGGDLTVHRRAERGLLFELAVPVTGLLPTGDTDATSVPDAGG